MQVTLHVHQSRCASLLLALIQCPLQWKGEESSIRTPFQYGIRFIFVFFSASKEPLFSQPEHDVVGRWIDWNGIDLLIQLPAAIAGTVWGSETGRKKKRETTSNALFRSTTIHTSGWAENRAGCEENFSFFFAETKLLKNLSLGRTRRRSWPFERTGGHKKPGSAQNGHFSAMYRLPPIRTTTVRIEVCQRRKMSEISFDTWVCHVIVKFLAHNLNFDKKWD